MLTVTVFAAKPCSLALLQTLSVSTPKTILTSSRFYMFREGVVELPIDLGSLE